MQTAFGVATRLSVLICEHARDLRLIFVHIAPAVVRHTLLTCSFAVDVACLRGSHCYLLP